MTSERTGCPVAHTKPAGECPHANGTNTSEWLKTHPMFSGSAPPAPVDPSNMMPAADQSRAPDQAVPLSTQRVKSSIPKGIDPAKGDVVPPHQSTDPNWEYPSEQMFFNAMRRKGWKPSEDNMPNVVAIHNFVNEAAWSDVVKWEDLHRGECPEGPKLVKFQGKPTELSPKARLLSFVGYAKPFDRHDWVIERCGHRVRYIIDFYNGPPHPNKPISMYLDVRPALDSLGAVFDRFVRFPLRELFKPTGGS